MSIETSPVFIWILSMLGETAVVGSLLAGAAFLFRAQITQFLNKDIERLKYQHQSQLEAYKISLIADVEKKRIQQDIKKQAALKVIEKKFNAFNELHEASLGNSVEFIFASSVTDPVDNLKHRRECTDRVDRLRSAIHKAEIFLEMDERDVLNELLQALGSYLTIIARAPLNTPADQTDKDALKAGLFRKELAVDQLLRKKIEEMMAAE